MRSKCTWSFPIPLPSWRKKLHGQKITESPRVPGNVWELPFVFLLLCLVLDSTIGLGSERILNHIANFFLRAIPTLTHCSSIISDIPFRSKHGTYTLIFHLKPFDMFFTHTLKFHLACFIFSTIHGILSGMYSDILSDALSGIRVQAWARIGAARDLSLG